MFAMWNTWSIQNPRGLERPQRRPRGFPTRSARRIFLGVVGVVLHPAHGYRKDRLSEVRRAYGQVEFSGRNRTGLREHFVEAEKPSRPADSVPEQRDGERPLCAHRPQVVEARLVGVLHGLVGKGGEFGAPELFPALFVVGEYPAKAFLQNALFELGGGVFVFARSICRVRNF